MDQVDERTAVAGDPALLDSETRRTSCSHSRSNPDGCATTLPA